MSASVELSQADGVAVLTLNDVPRKNAMTVALGDAFQARVRELASSDARAVVLTGNGGAFSAGGDLAMLENFMTFTKDASRDAMRAFYARYLSLLDLPMPIIAAVEGPAIGAGLCVATACDLMVVAEDAKLAFNFVKLGLHPGMGATAFLPRRVGVQKANDLLFTGRLFDGREAKSMGLAVDAVPRGETLNRALTLAKDIAAASPSAVRAVKANLQINRAELEQALINESVAQAQSYTTAEFKEGIEALKARRAPKF